MPTPLLVVGSSVKCPHSADGAILTKNIRVSSGGQAVATLPDPCAIAGCKNPVNAGGPCVVALFQMPATRVFIGGLPALLATSIGLCQPLSLPAVVQVAMPRAGGT